MAAPSADHHIFYLGIVQYKANPAKELVTETNTEVPGVNRWTRGEVVKFLRLVATNSTETLKANQRIAVKEGDKKVHVYGFDGDIAGVAITTDAYPQSTVQALLTKICNDFTNKYPRRAYDGVDPSSLKFEELTSLITQYQHPESADPMLKLQKELADTKVVLYDSIGALSQRGETLDSLVAKSDALNYSSKMFYKNASKQNSCCILM